MTRLIYYAAVLLLQFASSQGCTNLDGKTGNCMSFGMCTVIMNMLRDGIMSVDYLNNATSECASQGIALVCCPMLGGNLNSPSSIVEPTIEQLLPSRRECGFSMSHRIVGGEKADLEDFPWNVMLGYDLEYTGTRNYECGGVLISKNYILTAAHCVEGLPHWMRLKSVRLGEYDKRTEIDCIQREFGEQECADPVIEAEIEETIFHENYSPDDRNQQYDIALIRLSQNIVFTDYIRPICLPTTPEEVTRSYAGEYMVAGWGMTENNTASDIKLKIKVPSFDFSKCSSTYRKSKITLKSGQFCAGGIQGQDSCRGDSGGALMAIPTPGHPWWMCAGIVSFGPTPCGLNNWPGVYTKVSTYMDWIVSKLRL